MAKEKIESFFSISSWKKWIAKDYLGFRLCLALVFLIGLTFFLHYHEVRMEVLELGSISNRYIVANVDFEFPDEDNTFILKQQSIEDIGNIYKIEDKELQKKLLGFEKELIQNSNWRSELHKTTYEEIYEGVEALKEGLISSHFTDPRTLQKMKQLHFPRDGTYEISSSIPPYLTLEVWQEIKQNTLPSSQYDPAVTDFIISAFQKENWRLDQDTVMERRLKQFAQDSIPLQYTKVSAGTHIIEPGERVSPMHIAMLQAMTKRVHTSTNYFDFVSIVGSAFLALIITTLSIVYLRLYHKKIFISPRKMTLLVTIVLLTLALSKGVEYLLLYKAYNLVEVARFPLLVPFASLLVTPFLGAGVALFTSIFLTLVLGITLAFNNDLFLVMNLVCALCTILFSRSLHKRKDIFTVCGKVWMFSIPVIFSVNLINDTLWNFNVITDLMCTFSFLTITALLAVSLFPLLESIFHMMTDMTLMEYMDPNNELLRRLTLEAPGTYQHSLVVGNLAEAAARSISANDLFCRVASLYHDIGKLSNPHYFTENQLGGFNIHQLLTPLESAQVIIAHVSEGEVLAKKFHLPQSFIDIIREHHGTTLVYYFYYKQVEQMDGDTSKVKDSLFRYSGPKPYSKESALIMIADTVEAASRSLDEVTEDTLLEMVERLVSEKLEEGQLDGCQLTFEELEKAKKSIVKALLVTRHLRIKYPAKV